MKAIIISIRPRHCAKILNELKTKEIRKYFPKDYRGWIYIYCTKDSSSNLLHKNCVDIWWVEDKDFQKKNKSLGIEQQPIYNGKVIAHFYCDNVEEIKFINPNRTCGFSCEISDNDCYYNIHENECCLSQDDLYDYLQGKNGYAINISKLEIFDAPKELSDFYKVGVDEYVHKHAGTDIGYLQFWNGVDDFRLTKAPQSWQFIHFNEDMEEEE